MTISGLTNESICKYLRVNADDLDTIVLEAAKEAAEQMIASRTGLTQEQMDEHEDLTIAYLVLIQDMYDNRSYMQDSQHTGGANKVVESILGMHERNLL